MTTEDSIPAEQIDTEKETQDMEGLIRSMKVTKSRAKGNFTRQKNSLFRLIENNESSSALSNSQNRLDELAQSVMDSISELIKKVEKEQADALVQELEIFKQEYNNIVLKIEEKLTPSTVSNTVVSPAPTTGLQNDLTKQLSRVSIPVFNGDKHLYEGWKAAFTACVDNTSSTPEYKLLQLRQSLTGEALKVVQGLGHSATAYEVAKERLERKFGGKRRWIAIRLEELANIRPVRPNNAADIEKFADVLDLAVVNFKEAGKHDELTDGYFYSELLKKINEQMLTQYHRWVAEQNKTESVITLRDFVVQEAEYQIMASEKVHGMSKSTGSSGTSRQRSFHAEAKGHKRNCKVCHGNHGAWACDQFKAADVNKRWDIAKQQHLCFRCLGDDHSGKSCQRTRICGIDNCKKNHNRLLHRSQPQQITAKDSNFQVAAPPMEGDRHSSFRANHINRESVPLRTVPVILRNGDKKITVNALLDDGSTKTYINASVAAELEIQGQSHRITVDVVNGHTEVIDTMPVEFILESVDRRVCQPVSAFTVNKVTGNMEVIDWAREGKKWPHLQGINFPRTERRTVDILIGVDYANLHYSCKDVQGRPGQPFARLTPLGWTCIGGASINRTTHFARTYFTDDRLTAVTEKFWKVEDVEDTNRKIMTPEDSQVIEMTKNSLVMKDGHYNVAIPWKPGTKEHLDTNYEMALKRLQNTEARLKKTPDIAKSYSDTIEKYQEKGYIRKLAKEDTTDSGYYIPHFPVIRMDKDTTKTRIVFDASAKDRNRMSLNGTMYPGPKLQNDLFQVLVNFRSKPVALASDISEMYLQIKMFEEDRKYHRFLWRDLDQSRVPDAYEFSSLVFGTSASPFLAQLATQQHAHSLKDRFPKAADTVLKATFMDDSLTSFDTIEEAKAAYQDMIEFWALCGMKARKWLSNEKEVLKGIPQEDRAKEFEINEGIPTVKTLGIKWQADVDVLTFNPGDTEIARMTKRGFLSKLASVFDPLGLIAPFVVKGKVLMQDLWLAGIEWDEDMGTSLCEKVQLWSSELRNLGEIRVPRSLQPEYVVCSTVHTFVDASEKAYGAASYLRCVLKDGTRTSRLIASKTKVAPLSCVSIPRLELMGAMLGLKLTQVVVKSLEMDIGRATFWTDSCNVLWWIRGHSRQYKPFVANRIGEIQSATKPKQWRHVPTTENPADYVTRGLNITEMANCQHWWKGPTFLTQSEFAWPKTKVNMESNVPELRQKKASKKSYSFMACEKSAIRSMPSRLEPSRYSNWKHYLRVYVYVCRFIEDCRQEKSQRTTGSIQTTEIEDAEIQILAHTQKVAFPSEYEALSRGKELPAQSKLLPLHPRLDTDGLIRCSGRLQHAEYLSYDTKNPIILPKRNPVTKLIIKQCHEDHHHVIGTNHTLSILSQRFWIISAREEIRHWESECNMCKRRKARAASQIMAPLPASRLKEPLQAFSRVSVDYAGPFLTVQGRGKCRRKRYMCLFTCMTSRAVHLEMAYALDTDSFLKAFYRMVNRRGCPEEVFSDNGSNFIRANKELSALVKELDQDNITGTVSRKGIKWYFNPPLAPHFGGVHETMIKAAKKAVSAILSNSLVTDEELMTAFTGAESLINSRPLTYQSADPNDDVPLTPGHFLHGHVKVEIVPKNPDSLETRTIHRWRRVQELIGHFWKRWIREWLPTLNSRKKWTVEKRDLKENDIVMLLDPNTPRGQWPLAKVTKLIKGCDGHVRVADVCVGQKVIRRPICRLCPLELTV